MGSELGARTCIDLCEGPHGLVGEKGLAHGSRIGHACRLNDDPVEPVRPLLEFLEYVDQIATHGAADTSVYHIYNHFGILELRFVLTH
jgi:hypothetical protein